MDIILAESKQFMTLRSYEWTAFSCQWSHIISSHQQDWVNTALNFL